MLSMTRTEAELKLRQIFGFSRFYDEQWKAISALLQGRRILVIERTGFGKSLCYQFPAVLFGGITIVFSPLIALMRDQVTALRRRGIAARCINCEETPEDNEKSLQEAIDGKLKILYIAPERQENEHWLEAVSKIRLSMVVVDEAHTISQWGHDFRPAFRRIKNLVRNYLPQDMPILAVTATATEKVQHDIEIQLGNNLEVIRGPLMRTNFRLYVVKTTSEEEKMVWLKHHLQGLPGTGLVYAGTRAQTSLYMKWLQRQGIDAVEYNAGLDAQTRKEIEEGFLSNRWKCIVSTNALGMGIDKPDIRFVIHLQIPASPIHYYQEIGRAGRDGKPTDIILFFNEQRDENGVMADYRLPRSFIDSARPSERKYLQFIEALKEEPLSEKGMMMATNMKQTAVRVIREDLIEQGIIKEVTMGRQKFYEYRYDAPELDYSLYSSLNAAKLEDLQQMLDYVETKQPRMEFLCRYLGDHEEMDWTRTCDNTGLPKLTIEVQEADRLDVQDFKENLFPELSFKRIPNMLTGVAASYYGDSNVGRIIHHCKYENGGDFPDVLVRHTLRAFRYRFKNKKFDIILYVPSTESGDLVRNFAHTIGKILKIPVSDGLVKQKQTKPQKIFEQHYGKADNVKDAFTCQNQKEIMGKSILLIDDIYDSGATIKEIGRMLAKAGAAETAPLVIAKTVGGDNI